MRHFLTVSLMVFTFGSFSVLAQQQQLDVFEEMAVIEQEVIGYGQRPVVKALNSLLIQKDGGTADPSKSGVRILVTGADSVGKLAAGEARAITKRAQYIEINLSAYGFSESQEYMVQRAQNFKQTMAVLLTQHPNAVFALKNIELANPMVRQYVANLLRNEFEIQIQPEPVAIGEPAQPKAESRNPSVVLHKVDTREADFFVTLGEETKYALEAGGINLSTLGFGNSLEEISKKINENPAALRLAVQQVLGKDLTDLFLKVVFVGPLTKDEFRQIVERQIDRTLESIQPHIKEITGARELSIDPEARAQLVERLVTTHFRNGTGTHEAAHELNAHIRTALGYANSKAKAAAIRARINGGEPATPFNGELVLEFNAEKNSKCDALLLPRGV
ncbi:MAG: hypothetical protein AB1540_07620 [Bdellovibrionota bacterium]